MVTPVAPFALGMSRVRIATSLRCANAVCLFGLPSGRGLGGALSISSTSSLPASQAAWGCRTRGQGFVSVLVNVHRNHLGYYAMFPGSLQVLTSTYKLNLPSRPYKSLFCVSVLTSLANTKNARGYSYKSRSFFFKSPVD